MTSAHCSCLPLPSGATESKRGPFHVATEETQFLSHFCGRHACCRVRERRGNREGSGHPGEQGKLHKPSLSLPEPVSEEPWSRRVCKVAQEGRLELRTSAPHFCWREPRRRLQEVGPRSQAEKFPTEGQMELLHPFAKAVMFPGLIA